ncbi:MULTISPECIES: zinc-binding dehydrogenase [unclassified Fusibacter]|uniref:zinc-binding dehydrogenase n=1 Tax=unclassified Fusibacter TaxID=2624464 RepID=UPI001011EE5F|nr:MULTISPECIES: zinc-binding dehydrogenase [unclassified Fusibacter]MCK8058585.1 zinc-binding dehydrogenase [Fusibacter sp. A2]NPE22645.1 zinc-binding dehydrogenase [Fusibacter sp. A1]RXV60209.1 L-sorbose 1-phosphate reductase [Fusibacter sp. A1]
MKVKGVRLHGPLKVTMDTFELPEIKEDEILASVITNSLCMSTYKAAKLAEGHRRVPNNISTNPIVTGHEFTGKILKVGSKWAHQFKEGDLYSIQPALNWQGKPDSPGYSYEFFGGNMTKTIIPNEVMELGCLLKYDGKGFFNASLAEPMSCIIGAYNAHYHTKFGDYKHYMGIVDQGNMAILAGAGPMGLGAIDYILNQEKRPSLLVVVDISEDRLNRASEILTVDYAKKQGVKLIYVDGSKVDTYSHLMGLTDEEGYDDVFVYAPIAPLIETGDKLLRQDGCLNFFAGPTDTEFSAPFNFYNVHYKQTHLVGTSGGNTDDMIESLVKTAKGQINPAVMVTHIGGLNAAPDAVVNMPFLEGGKNLIYTGLKMPLTAIVDFEKLGTSDERYKRLAELVATTNGLWNVDAENYLLTYMDKIEDEV